MREIQNSEDKLVGDDFSTMEKLNWPNVARKDEVAQLGNRIKWAGNFGKERPVIFYNWSYSETMGGLRTAQTQDRSIGSIFLSRKAQRWRVSSPPQKASVRRLLMGIREFTAGREEVPKPT